MRFQRALIVVPLLAAVASAAAREGSVDEFVKDQMRKQHIPGVSLAVIQQGKIVKAEGYGLANVELNVPARSDTVYKIGSISKQFIATGIMSLVDEGKLGLDDKISTFLEGTPETWKDITVRHLLTHTSGIVREAPGFDPLKIQDDAEVIKSVYALPLRFAPGEKFEYCNAGYFALGEIIHRVAGTPWDEYLHKRVFAPLDMAATRATNMTEIVANRAGGYVWKDDKLQNANIYLAVRPSGALLSNVLDLAKWDAALDECTILKRSTLEAMWTPVKLNDGTFHRYGFGFQLAPIAGHNRIHHGGSLPGFKSEMSRFVDDKLTVIVLTNGDSAKADGIAIGVASYYIPGLGD